MKTILKMCALGVVIAGLGLVAGPAPNESSAAYDAQQVSKALAAFKLGTANSSRVVQHGTHLCSAHDHCGVGHLCCSGHCKAVQQC